MAACDELLTYDRVTAAQLGLTAQSLDSALYSAFGQSEVSIIYTQLNQYYVVLEVAPQYWQSPEGLKDIYLRTSGGGSDSAARGGQRPGQHHHRWPSTIRACSRRSRCRSISRRMCRLSDATGASTRCKSARDAFHDAGFFAGTSGLPTIAEHRART